MFYTNLLFFTITSVFVGNEAAKILGVFPTPSISHQVVFRPVMHELAKRGHEVVVITPDPVFTKKPSKNLKEIDVHDISYNIWNRFIAVDRGTESDLHTQLTVALQLLANVFEAQINSTNVQELINDKNQTFDLIFIESMIKPAFSFSYFFKAPVIEFSSLAALFDTFDRTGAISHRFFYPSPLTQKLNDLTLWERLSTLYTQFNYECSMKQQEKLENEMLKKSIDPNIPDIDELQKNIDMVFLNVRSIWDFNRPVPPNVIYLGGLHQNPDKDLPKDLQSHLDASKNGVIYMSLGTNVQPSLLSKEKIQIFNTVFSQLPYDVLFKWDKDELPGQSKNVKISKWFPQSDLLKHPKIKLFITQGGLQSTDEALTAGVPLIAVPMLGDQWFNAEQYVLHGIGKRIDIETITEKSLKDAIETVIKNKSYRENVVKLRNIMHDQQQTPLERAVWWTEYVLRHGGAKHLRAAAANKPWTEYYMLDVVLTVLTAFITILLAIAYVIRLMYNKYKQPVCKVKKS